MGGDRQEVGKRRGKEMGRMFEEPGGREGMEGQTGRRKNRKKHGIMGAGKGRGLGCF